MSSRDIDDDDSWYEAGLLSRRDYYLYLEQQWVRLEENERLRRSAEVKYGGPKCSKCDGMGSYVPMHGDERERCEWCEGSGRNC